MATSENPCCCPTQLCLTTSFSVGLSCLGLTRYSSGSLLILKMVMQESLVRWLLLVKGVFGREKGEGCAIVTRSAHKASLFKLTMCDCSPAHAETSQASCVLKPQSSYHSGSTVLLFNFWLVLQATGTSLQMAPVAPFRLSTTQPLTSASQSNTRLLISHSTAQLNPQTPWLSTASTLSLLAPPMTVPQLLSLNPPQPLTQPVCIVLTCSASA